MGDALAILWLEGVMPDRLRALPSARTIAARGVTAWLAPMPLAEATNCSYQTLTGLGSGKLGRFDAVRPVAYEARADTETPEGAWRRLLPDLVRAGGRTAAHLDVPVAGALAALEDTSADCMLARLCGAGDASDETLDAIIEQCAGRVGADGHVLVLTDAWSPAPHRLVNVNNFLADVGLLERASDGQSGEIVWPETLAYGLGAGQVWLNLRGREPEGAVEAGREADDVRATLIDLLLHEWRDPATGEPVVAQALTKEEAYSGEHVFKAPDLVVVYRQGYAPSPRARALQLDEASVLPGDQPTRPDESDSRANDDYPAARLIGAGPALAPDGEATGRLIDVAPSVLYLLGLPIPRHLDGQVMTALFSPSYRERTPLVEAADDAATLTEDDEDIIVGRLQALGYLG